MRLFLIACVVSSGLCLHSTNRYPVSLSHRNIGTAPFFRNFLNVAEKSQPLSLTSCITVKRLRGGTGLWSSLTIAEIWSIFSIWVVVCGSVWFIVRLDGKLNTLQADVHRLTLAQLEFNKASAKLSGRRRMLLVEGVVAAVLMKSLFPVKIAVALAGVQLAKDLEHQPAQAIASRSPEEARTHL